MPDEKNDSELKSKSAQDGGTTMRPGRNFGSSQVIAELANAMRDAMPLDTRSFPDALSLLMRHPAAKITRAGSAAHIMLAKSLMGQHAKNDGSVGSVVMGDTLLMFHPRERKYMPAVLDSSDLLAQDWYVIPA